MIVDDQKTWFSFKANRSVEEFFIEVGVFFTHEPKKFRLRDGEVLRAIKGPCIEPSVVFLCNTIFPIGFASFTNTAFDCHVKVGRYCSIASNVRVMGANHPIDRISSNSFTYGNSTNIHLHAVSSTGGSAVQIKPISQKPAPLIEHDVWVGQDVLSARGITLGTGCVVAAGAVVTKDVPPYAVVGGNPAKIIKYRFPESLIFKLLRSGWWEYAFPHFVEMPFDQPEAFLDQLQSNVAKGKIHPYSPEKIYFYKIVLGMHNKI